MTCSTKISLAVSIVASWSSSFDPKWAKRPLLLMPDGVGEVADREAVDALDGRELGRLAQDRGAAALAVAAALALGLLACGLAHVA